MRNQRVYHSLLDAGWTAEQIEHTSAKDLFAAFCQGEGLINWSDTLWSAVMDLQADQLQKQVRAKRGL